MTATNVMKREEGTRERMFRPNVDIVETSEALELYADLPGATPESIDVNFENGVLTILGKIQNRYPEFGKNAQLLLREYDTGDYRRTFEVSERIDSSRITASFTDGVLKVQLPKAEQAKPRKISVNIS